MPICRIAGRAVGNGEPCYVIAEAGSNHNGNLEQAKALVRLAASAGADAVKFQTFKAHRLYTKGAGTSDYLGSPQSIYDIIAAMEMPYEWLPVLAEEAAAHNIAFLSTPFDEVSADVLEPFVPTFKVASYEMTHLPLVRHLAQKGKPLVISTGTATLEEVRQTVEAVRSFGDVEFILLQCTARYPAPLDSLNLRAMLTMQREFNVPVGLSDHSRDPIVGPVAAVALGASVIEKHVTFSNTLPGPDHAFALEPRELFDMVSKIRQCELALGTGDKEPADVEQELRTFARRTIFSSRAIARGETLTNENLSVLRAGKAGHGLPPVAIDRLLGKRASRAIPSDTLVTFDDVAD